MLGAAGDEDLLALVIEIAVPPELGDDGVLELGDTVDHRILGESLVDGLLGGFLDVRWGIEIRLAGAEADDIAPLGAKLGRPRRDDQRGRGFDGPNPVR
jgi:hypothetical protein